ncbi:MAG: DNA gyrase inhibitor YacG [Pirellulaceae bacterium]
MNLLRCPICEKRFDPAASTAMPFCSDRCRQIDLGRWLNEKYSVPVERDPDDEEAAAGYEPEQ